MTEYDVVITATITYKTRLEATNSVEAGEAAMGDLLLGLLPREVSVEIEEVISVEVAS